jgi:hypothetical protein
MRDLDSYTRSEWLRLMPLVQRLKHVRNQAVSGLYRGRRTKELTAFQAANVHLSGRNLAITVAFNAPWAVELLVRSAAVNLEGMTLIVADNSSRPAARAEIAAFCRSRAAPYVPLPPNPEWSPNRSHGIAMNWAYDNIVRHFRPPVFAFLDHDLFPLQPVDLSLGVRDQPAYGMLRASRTVPDAWSLWAGFCVFDLAAVEARLLDFNYESPLMLDTGGANWHRLYRFLDRRALRFAEFRKATLDDPLGGGSREFSCIDQFVHVGGVSHKDPPDKPGREAFLRAIVEQTERGVPLLAD